MASDGLWCRWPVFCHCFLKGLSFPLCTFLAWFSWTVHIHVALFLGALFFPRVAVPVFVSSLLWLLQLRDVVWSQRGRCLQVHSSFSESFGLFRVLSCCRILLGIFYEYFYEKCRWILYFDCSAFADGFCWNGHFNNSFFQCMSMEYFSVYLYFLWFLYQCFLVFWLLLCPWLSFSLIFVSDYY